MVVGVECVMLIGDFVEFGVVVMFVDVVVICFGGFDLFVVNVGFVVW